MSLVSMRYGSWRWMIGVSLAAVLTFATLLAANSSGGVELGSTGSTPATASTQAGSPLAALAADHPDRSVEVIVQLRPGADPATGRSLVQSAGGVVTRDLPIINGLGTILPAEEAQRLSASPMVHAVSLNAAVENEATPLPATLATSYNQSVRSTKVWDDGFTGKGVGVAVIDTGIDGALPDFRVSASNPASRVIASAVVNPAAINAGDSFGHGTHVAGLIAGNGSSRPLGDPLRNRYAGTAPDANLISVKASDEEGNATVMDVIDGLQFVVDHKNDYNIRVVNLSLKSTIAESYKTDPLDAAVEAAWNSGIAVVVAAGNSGSDKDAVSYAPANDPYVITVGGVDDQGTKAIEDDTLASWSSRGTTQDGFSKPDVLAPGARLVSTIPAGSAYTQLCPTCVTDGQYFRVGGTSMAAAVVSGVAADLIESDPTLTPNEVKSQLIKRTRAVTAAESSTVLVDATGEPVPSEETRFTTTVGAEAAADKAIFKDLVRRDVNRNLTPNLLIDPATGLIDYTRASWSRASWSTAAEGLRASWSRASWSRASWSRASWSATPEACADLERASWSRASWSRASWSRASWSRASWSSDGMTSDLPQEDVDAIDSEIAAAQAECSALLSSIDPTRASWSRASWSRASWSTSFTK